MEILREDILVRGMDSGGIRPVEIQTKPAYVGRGLHHRISGPHDRPHSQCEISSAAEPFIFLLASAGAISLYDRIRNKLGGLP